MDDAYSLAKAYFDLGEYRRCAHALREANAPLQTFLREYATFLAGEKSKGQASAVGGANVDGGAVRSIRRRRRRSGRGNKRPSRTRGRTRSSSR